MKTEKIPDNMGKPEWEHQQTDLLYHDQCETKKHCEKCTKHHLLAWKHAPEPATQSTNDATILLCGKKYKNQYQLKLEST